MPRPSILLYLALALAGCTESAPAERDPADPCAALDEAAEHHLEAAQVRGLGADELAAHRAAARAALQPMIAPGCVIAEGAP